MSSPWLKFKQENVARWEVLHEGIPDWIKESVSEWFRQVYTSDRHAFLRDRLRAIEVNFRVKLSEDFDVNIDGGAPYFFASITNLLNREDQDKLLAFLDLTVQFIRSKGDDFLVVESGSLRATGILRILDGILKNGSKWTVVYERDAETGLVEQVDGRLTRMAQDLRSDALTRAWNEAFGVKPNPEQAVENAQKAVEAAASQADLSAARTSVYGNLIGDIKAHPDSYISAAVDAFNLQDLLAKKPQEINESFATWFATGLDLIQKTNPGRHHSAVTQDFTLQPRAAQQAVMIATVLCSLITSKSFQKKD